MINVKLSVVIPVYNERQYIEEILRRVQLVDIDKEIIIVDDCSTDGTREFLEELILARDDPNLNMFTLPTLKHKLNVENIKILLQEQNKGKGATLRRGFKEAAGNVVVIQDADLEYNPKDYNKLLEPIIAGEADVVYGSRFLGGPHRVLYFWHSIGNKFLTTLSNVFTNINLSDMETCYKMFRKEVLDSIELKQNRFGFEPEVTAKVAKKRVRIYEVPVSYYGRTYKEGKKINWKDGMKAIWCIIRYNLFK